MVVLSLCLAGSAAKQGRSLQPVCSRRSDPFPLVRFLWYCALPILLLARFRSPLLSSAPRAPQVLRRLNKYPFAARYYGMYSLPGRTHILAMQVSAGC